MPDITMCRNQLCPDKEKCFRWSAEPSPWQAYAAFEGPRGDKKCLNFVEDFRQNMSKEVDQPTVG